MLAKFQLPASTSRAARSKRLVVPSAFVPVERAEQTTAMRWLCGGLRPALLYSACVLFVTYPSVPHAFVEEGRKWILQHDILSDLRRELAHTRPTKLLHNPIRSARNLLLLRVRYSILNHPIGTAVFSKLLFHGFALAANYREFHYAR